MGIPFLNRIRERYGLKLAVAFTAVLLLTVGVGTAVSADASAQLRDDVEGHMYRLPTGAPTASTPG